MILKILKMLRIDKGNPILKLFVKPRNTIKSRNICNLRLEFFLKEPIVKNVLFNFSGLEGS